MHHVTLLRMKLQNLWKHAKNLKLTHAYIIWALKTDIFSCGVLHSRWFFLKIICSKKVFHKQCYIWKLYFQVPGSYQCITSVMLSNLTFHVRLILMWCLKKCHLHWGYRGHHFSKAWSVPGKIACTKPCISTVCSFVTCDMVLHIRWMCEMHFKCY